MIGVAVETVPVEAAGEVPKMVVVSFLYHDYFIIMDIAFIFYFLKF